MPKSKYKTSNPTEMTVLNVPDAVILRMNELRQESEQLYELKDAILRELNKLPLLQKTILYDFYIRGFRWVQVSRRVHYSATHCKKIRNHAVDNLARQFSKNELIKKFNYPN
ncbi:MAG: hypothetical protein LBS36_13535 [Oscillospiraceae bacterium]|nr:hypothetical protein [Oscillospiraceae bacterium]